MIQYPKRTPSITFPNPVLWRHLHNCLFTARIQRIQSPICQQHLHSLPRASRSQSPSPARIEMRGRARKDEPTQLQILTSHFSLWIAEGLDYCCVSISCAHYPASIGSTRGRFDFRCCNYFSFRSIWTTLRLGLVQFRV